MEICLSSDRSSLPKALSAKRLGQPWGRPFGACRLTFLLLARFTSTSIANFGSFCQFLNSSRFYPLFMDKSEGRDLQTHLKIHFVWGNLNLAGEGWILPIYRFCPCVPPQSSCCCYCHLPNRFGIKTDDIQLRVLGSEIGYETLLPFMSESVHRFKTELTFQNFRSLFEDPLPSPLSWYKRSTN